MGTYAVNLLEAMRVARPALEVLLFTDSLASNGLAPDGLRPQLARPTKGHRWQLWERFVLPWHAALAKANLLHSPANTTPPMATLPRVVTVHDVIPYMPHLAAEPLRGQYWLRTIPHAVRTAAAVLTDSETSRSDIARVFDVPLSRITVVPLAAGSDVHRFSGDMRAALNELEVREPYVLALAAVAPRKNTIGTLRVFQRAARANADLQLVLIGVGRELRPRIVEMMTELGIPLNRVRVLDFVDVQKRNALYSGASVFLFLSLYEGFGLPILEAMRCGAPVLCSNRSSCTEVAGEAAMFVDPTNEPAAADLLVAMALASDSDRRQWQGRGWAQEQRFTWKRTAEMTLSVYDRALG